MNRLRIITALQIFLVLGFPLTTPYTDHWDWEWLWILLPLGLMVILFALGWFTYKSFRRDTSRENLATIPDDDDVPDVHYFEKIITTFMRERHIPGASVAVSKNGEFLFKRGYGRASMYRIVTPWSVFRIGSVSKPITAMGILRLVEDGELCLDCKVFGESGILSEFYPKEKGDPRLLEVTVRHLLQHTGGWDQRLTGDPLMWRGVGAAMGSSDPPKKHVLLAYMMSQPLQFDPGSRYAYSNFGYFILGRVIEQVAKQPYDAFIRKMLYAVGIYSMKIGHTRRQLNDLYEVEYFADYPDNEVKSVFPEDGMTSGPYGGFYLENMDSSGGWLSSASDLVRFFDALNNTHLYWRLLSQESLHQMLAPPTYSGSNNDAWYGLGVVVQDGGHTWWHSGVLDGSTSILTHDRSGFTWAVVCNVRLKHNDIDDLMKVAIRKVSHWFGMIPLPTPPLADSVMSRDQRHLVKLMTPKHKFPHAISLISQHNFRLTWVDALQKADGSIFFNTIWKRNDEEIKWKVYHGLTSSTYRRRYRSKIAQGYRLLHINTYVDEKRLRYVVIFVKDSWPTWIAYHGYSPHQHKMRFYQLHKEGFRLVTQSVTEYKGKLYVAAIYDQLNMGEIRVRMGLNMAEFNEEFAKELHNGRILSYLQAYTHGGALRFSAIWGARTASVWAAQKELTKYTLLNRLLDYAEMNIPLACVTAYEMDDIVYFAALWR